MLFPLVANSQLLNETILVENYHGHELHIDETGNLNLTYQRVWESGSGGSEPTLDSTHIYLTQLDSLANPIGELWSLKQDSNITRWYPQIVGSGGNLSWLYKKYVRDGNNGEGSFRGQLLNDPQFPNGSELVLMDSSIYYSDSDKLEISNGQYMFYWKDTQMQIYGQRFDYTNQLVGDRFELYSIEPSDSQETIINSRVFASRNTIADRTLLLWGEEFYEFTFPFTIHNTLSIMDLQADGTPSGPPISVLSIVGDIELKKLFIQNDGTIIMNYYTHIHSDIPQYDKWVHSIYNFGESNESETIYQVPDSLSFNTVYFPLVGPGIIIYNLLGSASLRVQRIQPDGALVGEPEILPFNTPINTIQDCILQDGKLILLEGSNYHELFAHVYTFADYVSVEPRLIIYPQEPRLTAVYPNPFNPSATIEYDLPDHSDVSLVIYDIAGREVQTLISKSQSQGSYVVSWDGATQSGKRVAGGMYFARLQAGEYSSVVKMVYLK